MSARAEQIGSAGGVVPFPDYREGVMTRHPTARRLHQQSTPDDTLTEGLLQVVLWAKGHLRALVAGVVVVIVAVLAFSYAMNMREARRVEATMRLEEVRQTALSGNHSLAIRDLEEFISVFSGTAAADEGRILLAQSALAESQPEKAIEVLMPLARELEKDLGAPAAFLLAAAYEQHGDAAQAVEAYLRVADQATIAYQRRDALQQAARVREGQGDAAGAAELYQRLVEATAENSPERGIAELRLAEARARAGQN